eukprot:GGOE01037595.1.p1 GENE.GGOE01037595.1~~GGOE01037595.1.p1  ORF type:complete len:912 (-),score=279.50 GGOE01037595.1:73-2751(-)
MAQVVQPEPPRILAKEQVIAEETEAIQQRRAALGLQPGGGIAMALSGGGIRAAAFDCGVMWRLAQVGLLKDVDTISTVSGGGICGSAYVTEALRTEKQLQREWMSSGQPAPPVDDAFFLGVVKRMTLRMQQHCGYFVSWSRHPESKWDSLRSGCMDSIRFAAIITGIFTLNPVFLILIATMLANLVDSSVGPFLRHSWCMGRSSWRSHFNLHGFYAMLHIRAFGANVLGLLGTMAGAALLAQCFLRRNSTPWLVAERLCAFCWRALLLMGVYTVCIQLAWTLQYFVYKDLDRGPPFLAEFPPHHPLNYSCSQCLGLPVTMQFISNITDVDTLPESHIRDLMVTAASVVGCLVVLLLLGVSAAAPLLMLTWPLVLCAAIAVILRWRLFGILDGHALVNTVDYGPEAWRWFHLGVTLTLAAVAPVYHYLRRFCHRYYRFCIRRSFFPDGRDVHVGDLRGSLAAPYWLVGCIQSDYQVDHDEEWYSMFAITPMFSGCDRTGYIRTPPDAKMSKIVAMSGAGIDGLILTQYNKSVSRFIFRFLLSSLNLGLGDWSKFSANEGAHWLLSEVVGWWLMLGLLLLSNNVTTQITCSTQIFEPAVMDRIVCYIATFTFLISFFTFTRLKFMLRSPTVRLFHQVFAVPNITAGRGPPDYVYLSDGGLVEDSGLVDLLRRRRKLIVATDTGDDPGVKLLDLRNAMQIAIDQRLCTFFDPQDPRRGVEWLLQTYSQSDVYRNPHLHLGILYGWPELDHREVGSPMSSPNGSQEVGHLFIIRMRRVRDMSDPVCIQPILTEESFDATTPLRRPRESSETTSLLPENTYSRSDLGECCCDCCHTHFRWLGGGFPDLPTGNQFFTPTLFANFCRYGWELSEAVVKDLLDTQNALAKDSPAASPTER